MSEVQQIGEAQRVQVAVGSHSGKIDEIKVFGKRGNLLGIGLLFCRLAEGGQFLKAAGHGLDGHLKKCMFIVGGVGCHPGLWALQTHSFCSNGKLQWITFSAEQMIWCILNFDPGCSKPRCD